MSMMNRPQSARVRIRSTSEKVNPQPLSSSRPESPSEESVASGEIQEYLTEDNLKSISGESDLLDIKYLELMVDTRETSLGRFGLMVPNLEELKLSNSVIGSIRDLGTTLSNLRVLWLGRCSLRDLDGISSFYHLQEFYVPFNDISECSPLTMLDKLEILDLEGNSIKEIAQVSYLALCSSLRSLTLEGNLLSQSFNNDNASYRKSIFELLPLIQTLDGYGRDVLVSPSFALSELLVVNDAVKSKNLIDDPLLNDDAFGEGVRPSTALVRPPTSRSSRPQTASKARPLTARPLTAHPDLLSETRSEESDETDSALTRGSDVLFCGNPLKALKARKAAAGAMSEAEFDELVRQIDFPSTYTLPTPAPPVYGVSPKKLDVYLDEDGDSSSKDAVFSDLRSWRQQFDSFTQHLNLSSLTASPALHIADSFDDDTHGEKDFENDPSTSSSNDQALIEMRGGNSILEERRRARRALPPPNPRSDTTQDGGSAPRILPQPTQSDDRPRVNSLDQKSVKRALPRPPPGPGSGPLPTPHSTTHVEVTPHIHPSLPARPRTTVGVRRPVPPIKKDPAPLHEAESSSPVSPVTPNLPLPPNNNAEPPKRRIKPLPPTQRPIVVDVLIKP